MGAGKKSERLVLPHVLQEEWCDFRIAFESGMTLKDIAIKFHCDPRTVRNAIANNRGSADLGKWTSQKKLEAHLDAITKVLGQTTSIKSLSNLSQQITSEIQKNGYTGGERTVRNYLYSRSDVKALMEMQQKKSVEVSNDKP